MSDQEPTTLIGKLATQAAPVVSPLVASQTEKWVQWLADTLTADLVPNMPDEAQGLVLAGIETLRANAGLLGQTTQAGFLGIVHHLALGNEDQARTVWLASGASLADALKALDDDSAATRSEAASRATTWGQVKTISFDFLKAAGSAAIPMLIHLIPLAAIL